MKHIYAAKATTKGQRYWPLDLAQDTQALEKPLKLREKLGWFLFITAYFAGGYLLINQITAGRDAFLDVSFALESKIPFVPEFIFGYAFVYFNVLIACIVIDNRQEWHRLVVSFILATTIAYTVFLAFPVKMELRPDISGLTGPSIAVTRFFYMIDMPYNCFPSLHLTYPMLATLVSWRSHRVMRWFFALVTILVAVSVVLVKQHYIADVIAGLANGAICFQLAAIPKAWWTRLKSPA